MAMRCSLLPMTVALQCRDTTSQPFPQINLLRPQQAYAVRRCGPHLATCSDAGRALHSRPQGCRPLQALPAQHEGSDSSDDQQDHQQESGAGEQAADVEGALEISPDWRSFRARLMAMEQAAVSDVGHGLLTLPALTSDRWAHALPRAERGCLLVARKPDMGPFTHSVILILDHDVVKGSSGFVLNQPSRSRIAEVSIDGDLALPLKRQTLFVGGPISTSTLHVLHSCTEVEGSFEILNGVYAGGLDHASRLVARGEADSARFKLLAGYACWSAGQLQAEVMDGCWWVVAASSAFVADNLQGTSKTTMWEDLLRLANIDEDAPSVQERS